MTELQGAEWALSPNKRALDLLGITALMPLFVPAGTAIATTIYSVDGMNPIFSHTRYGLKFEPFPFYKFQTMPPDVEHDVPSQGSLDNRRTTLGAKLSAKHLDEMPQTINIYSGKVSMVGPRALVWQDIEDTLDVLSPAEQKEWKASRWTVKPGEFGKFQLESHVNSGGFANRAEMVRARAYSDIEYAASASFKTDMAIIFSTATAAYDTFRGKEYQPGYLRCESGAIMFHKVAQGLGVSVTDQEHDWWRATLLAARSLDDIVDQEAAVDLTTQVNNLVHGRVINGIAADEAEAFRLAFWKEPYEKRQALLEVYLSLPQFQARKKSASCLEELVHISTAEADMFASMLYLEPTDKNRIRLNNWIRAFSRTGYMADLALDARRDYDSGTLSVNPSASQRTWLGVKAVLESGKLLAAAPLGSYAHLARGVIKTLLW